MARIKRVSIFDPLVSAYRDVDIDKAKMFIDYKDKFIAGINSNASLISIYDPFVHAYREVSKAHALKLVDEIPKVIERIRIVEEE